MVIEETFTSPKCHCENSPKAVCHMQMTHQDVRFPVARFSLNPFIFQLPQKGPPTHLGSDSAHCRSAPSAGLTLLLASASVLLHLFITPQHCSLTAERTCKYTLKKACYFHSLDGTLWVPARTARHCQVQGICHQLGEAVKMQKYAIQIKAFSKKKALWHLCGGKR